MTPKRNIFIIQQIIILLIFNYILLFDNSTVNAEMTLFLMSYFNVALFLNLVYTISAKDYSNQQHALLFSLSLFIYASTLLMVSCNEFNIKPIYYINILFYSILSIVFAIVSYVNYVQYKVKSSKELSVFIYSIGLFLCAIIKLGYSVYECLVESNDLLSVYVDLLFFLLIAGIFASIAYSSYIKHKTSKTLIY